MFWDLGVRRVLIGCGVLCGLACADSPSPLTFKERGILVKQMSLRDLQRVVPVQSITVFEPHEKKKVSYRGFAFIPLVKAIYGENWKQHEEVLATCNDGYQPSIAMHRFEQNSAFLVFEREDQKQFEVTNLLQAGEKVPLGPLYLIWDNLKFPQIQKEGALAWPYQVNTIDLIRFSDRFPKMAPPQKAATHIQRGFSVFRRDCMPCHTVNGEGGAKGVELNYPASATEYMQPEWLRRWILDPSTVRAGSACQHSINKEITGNKI